LQLAELLHACEQRLQEARSEAAQRPDDGRMLLRVAQQETRRADLLARADYEAGRPGDKPLDEDDQARRQQHRQQFLRTDPDGALSRATQRLQSALRAGLDPLARRQALELLAATRAGLGDYRGEVAALARAVRFEPDEAPLWMRLAEACARARQFTRANAARERARQLLEESAR
jgi:hypothetical protein